MADRKREDFSDVGTYFAGDVYVAPFAAPGYIDACIRESLAIVGVDVFRREAGHEMKSDLNLIADFSSMLQANARWVDIVGATAEEARRFLEQVPLDDDVRLNFTILSEDERRAQ